MTFEELRKIVFDTVREYGPEAAREILMDRLQYDPDFAIAAVLHGIDLTNAVYESRNQVIQ